MLLFLSLLISVAIAPTAVAQDSPKASAAAYEGRAIGRIDFDPPDQPLPRAELEQLVPVRVGSPLNLADVHTAIQNLFNTGRYSNISISAFEEGSVTVLNISTEL